MWTSVQTLCTSVYMCFAVTCWERTDLLALVCGVYCEVVTFPLVSWVRCGTWLYRFLIFAPLLTLLSSLIAYRWFRPQNLWRFQRKDLYIDERDRGWCFVCHRAHRGFTVGFLLLQYSVVYTVHFFVLSIIYYLFIYWILLDKTYR